MADQTILTVHADEVTLPIEYFLSATLDALHEPSNETIQAEKDAFEKALQFERQKHGLSVMRAVATWVQHAGQPELAATLRAKAQSEADSYGLGHL